MLERAPGAEPRGLAAIALGKQGSFELNYSSDIDPILLFDPATLPHRANEEPQEAAVRIGRPRGLAGLPEAHSGPAFATLAGLAQYVASNPVDLRQIVPAKQQTVHRVSPTNLLQRLISAVRSGY